jgi:transcriptional regulator with XRE-family HTH domain
MGLSDLDDLGSRVRAARSYAKLSQQALGDALGLTRAIVNAIEDNDDRHPLTVSEAYRIAAVCGVPVAFIVDGWNVNRPIQDRLTDIERRLQEVAEANGELSAHERELLGRFEELVQRLGRDIGRGQPRSRGAKDYPPVAVMRGQ